jgi:hypothetical protein
MGTEADVREKEREVYNRFIAADFHAMASPDMDPFYLSNTTPTTFKIGKCEQKDDLHVTVQVQLYWRQEGRTDQKEVYADVSDAAGKWLIHTVESR